ncbi:hypothetical protein [Candidatus Nitrotoga arctica]|uniref:Methyl-accepting chemotaxis protein n=1 Tax=Candidatus Nitrotoga arctica TaxID=453162 RepID=A0ABM8YZ49_9PROT|nr:hypothetical protein [Candidatus Nitrotoga arctica]CAG9932811.1 protein of unknown function [Candidatus Nitrotoga arctica]
MKKALTQMNVPLINVIAEIVGNTGQDIAGERDRLTDETVQLSDSRQR